ncbi:hypothetical protein TNCT_688031 [Trichonephila clavata]|uniref:Uncharacterized protein n=1 Tax=Trichonephila clavata TaxID=2740835 RepID=A0A8X6GPZ7_TRICU|nr:hypothetical protein TNCT_688031 [Trichonephila clavata]
MSEALFLLVYEIYLWRNPQIERCSFKPLIEYPLQIKNNCLHHSLDVRHAQSVRQRSRQSTVLQRARQRCLHHRRVGGPEVALSRPQACAQHHERGVPHHARNGHGREEQQEHHHPRQQPLRRKAVPQVPVRGDRGLQQLDSGCESAEDSA